MQRWEKDAFQLAKMQKKEYPLNLIDQVRNWRLLKRIFPV